MIKMNTFLYGAFTKFNVPYNDLHYSTGDLTRLVVSASGNPAVYILLESTKVTVAHRLSSVTVNLVSTST